MMTKTDQLLLAMMEHEAQDAARIQHFIKVFEFARLIGKAEGLEEEVQTTLEVAAIVHDIGIHLAEEKYGSCDGKYQESEGPAKAEELLTSLGWPEAVIKRVSYLVGHHHTYTDMDGMDYQILVEADFLVNLYEQHTKEKAQAEAYHRIFRTESGKRLFCTMFSHEVSE